MKSIRISILTTLAILVALPQAADAGRRIDRRKQQAQDGKDAAAVHRAALAPVMDHAKGYVGQKVKNAGNRVGYVSSGLADGGEAAAGGAARGVYGGWLVTKQAVRNVVGFEGREAALAKEIAYREAHGKSANPLQRFLTKSFADKAARRGGPVAQENTAASPVASEPTAGAVAPVDPQVLVDRAAATLASKGIDRAVLDHARGLYPEPQALVNAKTEQVAKKLGVKKKVAREVKAVAKTLLEQQTQLNSGGTQVAALSASLDAHEANTQPERAASDVRPAVVPGDAIANAIPASSEVKAAIATDPPFIVNGLSQRAGIALRRIYRNATSLTEAARQRPQEISAVLEACNVGASSRIAVIERLQTREPHVWEALYKEASAKGIDQTKVAALAEYYDPQNLADHMLNRERRGQFGVGFWAARRLKAAAKRALKAEMPHLDPPGAAVADALAAAQQPAAAVVAPERVTAVAPVAPETAAPVVAEHDTSKTVEPVAVESGVVGSGAAEAPSGSVQAEVKGLSGKQAEAVRKAYGGVEELAAKPKAVGRKLGVSTKKAKRIQKAVRKAIKTAEAEAVVETAAETAAAVVEATDDGPQQAAQAKLQQQWAEGEQGDLFEGTEHAPGQAVAAAPTGLVKSTKPVAPSDVQKIAAAEPVASPTPVVEGRGASRGMLVRGISAEGREALRREWGEAKYLRKASIAHPEKVVRVLKGAGVSERAARELVNELPNSEVEVWDAALARVEKLNVSPVVRDRIQAKPELANELLDAMSRLPDAFMSAAEVAGSSPANIERALKLTGPDATFVAKGVRDAVRAGIAEHAARAAAPEVASVVMPRAKGALVLGAIEGQEVPIALRKRLREKYEDVAALQAADVNEVAGYLFRTSASPELVRSLAEAVVNDSQLPVWERIQAGAEGLKANEAVVQGALSRARAAYGVSRDGSPSTARDLVTKLRRLVRKSGAAELEATLGVDAASGAVIKKAIGQALEDQQLAGLLERRAAQQATKTGNALIELPGQLNGVPLVQTIRAVADSQ